MTQIKLFSTFLIFITLVFISCEKGPVDGSVSSKIEVEEPPPEGSCIVFDQTLIAGQYTEVGFVKGIYDESTGILTVSYNTTDGWILTEVHFEIQKYKEDIPVAGKGNPKVGKFLIGEEDLSSDTYTIEINLNELDPYPLYSGDVFYAAAHAVVQKTVDSNTRKETAWANGTRFVQSNGSWAMYFTYNLSCNITE